MEQSRTSSDSRRRRQHGESEAGREDRSFANRAPFASTIRTVTPDSIPEGHAVRNADVERFVANSPPLSPHGSLPTSPSQLSVRYRTRAGSNIERSHIMSAMEKALPVEQQQQQQQQPRPRTRTIGEHSYGDTTPAGMFKKGRRRGGSIHSSASMTFNDTEEDIVTSIGHPTIIAPPYQLPSRKGESSRTKLVKSQPRAAEPRHDPVLPPRRPAETRLDSQSHVPLTDTRKILHLMKSSRGRMEGPLAFRRADTTPWSLSYCSINDESGSLVYEPKSNESFYRTLITDLRGCNIGPAWDAESQMPFLDICPRNSKLKVHLRPHSQDEFDSWFAALLCWQPIRPKGIQNRMTKPVSAAGSDRRPQLDSRRHSELALLKEAPIIKVGKMIFWDTNVSYSYAGTPKGGKSQPSRVQSFGSRRWRRVSCTLRENGELKLYSEQDVTMESCLQLSQLCRCAVQRLDPSVLDNDFCLAIYPQYSASANQQSLIRPIFLSLESRVLYEVWLVLLRAFTIPQLYGPKQFIDEQQSNTGTPPQTIDMFRMERSLQLRIVEARLVPPVSPQFDSNERPKSQKKDLTDAGGYFAEVLLDGETRGKTVVKDEALNPFWREEFEFSDLPAVLSVTSILLKKRPPSQVQNERSMHKEMKRIHDTINSADGGGGQAGISFDRACGKVDIYIDDLEPGKAMEKWWPLTNLHGQTIGDVLVSITTEESVILMARDYQPMSELLHRFSNGLTLQLAQMAPGELRRLSEYLLNIFQVSGSASDWLMSLVEEEIDGTTRETPTSRLRFGRRADSNESGEGTQFGPVVERELLVRDMGKTATLEANLLFRGNTLLTKSLDLHMKRLGKEYLEETLGDKLKEIADKDPDCEVDPNRVGNLNDLDRNWRKLIAWTSECWKCIYQSALRCPAELRFIFRHIRACAEDRYGDFLRTVAYSSVSGFLFLRFFVPAILNPKLFGLLKDHPKSNARRTLTLIAKSLQGLANVTTFGSKEQWMEPMNIFLSSHRIEFKTFLDSVCSISSSTLPLIPIPPSYSTPLAILTRLPPTSREGFPSLPYLIDHARNFAALVTLWLDHAGNIAGIQESDGDLLRFHQLVVSLRGRTEDCLASAEQAERPSSRLSFQWEELVEHLENPSTQVGSRSTSHTRMNSVANSTVQSNSGSSTPGRDISFDSPSVETSRVGSKSNGQQNTYHSSPTSHTTSPNLNSDSQAGPNHSADRAGISRSARDEITNGYAPTSGQKTQRVVYGHGYADGWTTSREAVKVRGRERSRQTSVTPHDPMPSSSVPEDVSGPAGASPDGAERSWLVDKTSTSGEDDKISGRSSERAYRSDGEREEVSASTSANNERESRRPDGHRRHLAVQLEAEQIDPGQARDWVPRRGKPRRDWSSEERIKRGERPDTGSRDGSFTFGTLQYQQQSRSHPSSTPGSRLGSRPPSVSSDEIEEETTALPVMSYARGVAFGSGPASAPAVEMRERDAKEREKHLFERIGFKKRKG